MNPLQNVVIGVCCIGLLATFSTAEPSEPAPAEPADVPVNTDGSPHEADAKAAPVIQLNALLNEPEQKLLEAARRLGHEVRAALTYDGRINALAAEEQLLERAHVDRLAAAQTSRRLRESMRGELDQQVESLHRDASDTSAAQTEIIRLIEDVRPQLVSLLRQQHALEQEAARVTARLEVVRRDRIVLQRRRSLAASGVLAADHADIAALPPDLLHAHDAGAAPTSTATDGHQQDRAGAAPTRFKSVEEALRSLEGL